MFMQHLSICIQVHTASKPRTSAFTNKQTDQQIIIITNNNDNSMRNFTWAPPSSAELKNELELYFLYPLAPAWR
jgi:hypothetical protein